MIKQVTLANGIELEVQQRGNHPELLFLHGFGDSCHVWQPLVECLAQDYISISLRGFGGSSKTPQVQNYTFDNFAEDAVLLLDSLNIETIHIVGHSLGSFIAQRIAAHHPQRVKKLVLIGSGTTSYNPSHDLLIQFIDQQEGDAITLDFIQGLQTFNARPLYDPETMAMIAEESTRSNFTVWKKVLQIMREAEHLQAIQKITTSTLVLWGTDDSIFPHSEEEVLVTNLSNASLEVLPDLGHAPFLEKPEVIATLINDFITS